MWTLANRRQRDRAGLRYPSDLSDAEWALVEPLIPPAKPGGRRRSADLREVLNAILYLLATGRRWRALPEGLPPRSTVHGYLRLWDWDGTLARVHRALYVRAREEAGRDVGPGVVPVDGRSATGAGEGGRAPPRRAPTRARGPHRPPEPVPDPEWGPARRSGRRPYPPGGATPVAAPRIRSDYGPAELRALARRARDGRVSTRLLALANVLEGLPREEAARLAGMSAQTLRNWVVRYNAEGVDGLRDRRRTGRPRASRGPPAGRVAAPKREARPGGVDGDGPSDGAARVDPWSTGGDPGKPGAAGRAARRIRV